MKSVENMTITKPRLKKALKNQIEPLIMPMVVLQSQILMNLVLVMIKDLKIY